MTNLEDFKKLIKFQVLGNYRIYCCGEEVHLFYETEEDLTEGSRCTFVFCEDRHTYVCYFEEYKNSDWTVEKFEDVDWRNTEPIKEEKNAF